VPTFAAPPCAVTWETDPFHRYRFVFALNLETLKPYNVSMPFSVQNVVIGGPQLFLIAGPCVIESEEHALSWPHPLRHLP